MREKGQKHVDPTKILFLGFLGIIVLGATLLYLPFFQEENVKITFSDALFTATSAITVTGLNVIDPGATFNRMGEILLIVLIQIGGLGFMTFGIWVFVLLGKKISIKQRLIMQENLGEVNVGGIVRLAINLLWITLAVEGIGALLLATVWHESMGWYEGMFQGFFHAVSAFNNAGFSLFPNSLMDYATNPLVNVTVILLILLGGIGFVVILDLINKKFQFKHLNLHTKITLVTNLVLIVVGMFFFLLIEFKNLSSLGFVSLFEKLLPAVFQVITTRTAGFNTIEIAGLTQATLFIFIIYMVIGASSGSTGGGIKVTTTAIIWLSLKSVLRGKRDVTVFKRTVPTEIIFRSMTIVLLSVITIVVVTLLLDLTESGQSFLDILFEVTSAFGTVGLSTGITPELTTLGRYIIMITMFIGRLGPLTFGFALARNKEKQLFKYAEEKIMIG